MTDNQPISGLISALFITNIRNIFLISIYPSFINIGFHTNDELLLLVNNINRNCHCLPRLLFLKTRTVNVNVIQNVKFKHDYNMFFM